jgi:hypothetical protein
MKFRGWLLCFKSLWRKSYVGKYMPSELDDRIVLMEVHIYRISP